jgi:hypothetical protein
MPYYVMSTISVVLCVLLVVSVSIAGDPTPIPLRSASGGSGGINSTDKVATDKARAFQPSRLREFVHVTDIHYDNLYKTGGTTKSGCHNIATMNVRRMDSSKEKLRADEFGVHERCDTPVSLLNATFEFLMNREKLLETESKRATSFVLWYVVW